MKADFEAKIADLSAPVVDDPVFVELNAKFVGAILYDFETRASWKLYRVSAIQFVRSYASNRLSCWEATCEPVYRDTSSGLFHVPADQRVNDSKVIKTTALQGYALAEYPHGLDKDPSYLPWVQQYITHFSDVIQPRYSQLLARKVQTNLLPAIYYYRLNLTILPIVSCPTSGLPIHPLTRLQTKCPPHAAAKDLTSLLPDPLQARNKNAKMYEDGIWTS
jgi:hypothetical protein